MTKHAQLSIIDALMTREEDQDLLPELAEINIDALSCVPNKNTDNQHATSDFTGR